MTHNISITESLIQNVIKTPTDIYGLKWKPSLEPNISDDQDVPPAGCSPPPSAHLTFLDKMALIYGYGKLGYTPKLIVEIGVNRSENYEASSTSILLKLKSKECTYIGIDIDDKSDINDVKNNVYTLCNDSVDYEKLYNLMNQLGHEQIDFMFIDGWHSVNQVIKEWKYWEKMVPNGVMVFHDTNYHPGPVALMDAIDTNIFSVEYFGRGESDWGIGVVQRLKL